LLHLWYFTTSKMFKIQIFSIILSWEKILSKPLHGCLTNYLIVAKLPSQLDLNKKDAIISPKLPPTDTLCQGDY